LAREPDRHRDVHGHGDRGQLRDQGPHVTRVRAASAVLGAAFGFLISWGQFIAPDRIRDMLLLRDSYMWLMFASAVAVAVVGLRLMRRVRVRSLLTGEPVSWTTARPERRHVAGAAIFGVGWAVSDVCP